MAPGFKSSALTTRVVVFFGLCCFTLAVFREVVTFRAFGAEFPLYWVYGHDLTMRQVLNTYTTFNLGWYRPTATALVAWIGDQFIGWHNLAGWKIYHLLSLALTGCTLYWFVLLFAPSARIAAVLAACYYIGHPAQDTLPLQMIPFDELHVIFCLLSAGFYWRALQNDNRSSWTRTAISLIFFIIALTCKEVVVALPLFLVLQSAVVLFRQRAMPQLRLRIGREILRLSFFVVANFLYWLYHVRAIQDTMGANATYRMAVNWEVILNNMRMLPLVTIRIFYLAGYKIGWRSYFENTTSTVGGLAILLITCAGWYLLLRRRSAIYIAGLLFLAWMLIFLIIPIYSGGQIWHVTLSVCGYAALFGLGAMALIEAIPLPRWRYAVWAACITGLLCLGVVSLKDELHNGLFTTPALLTRDLLVHPPIPPQKLGPNATIFMEDRMNLGGWPYGCYGHLMRYIYQRTDLHEVIVTPGKLTPADTATLMNDPQAYYVVYDNNYRWRDATAEMRSDLRITPATPDIKTAEPVQFTALNRDGHPEPAAWSIDPQTGSIDATGWYTPPAEVTAADENTFAIAPALASAPRLSGVRFVAGSPVPTPVHVTATTSGEGKRFGKIGLTVNVVRSESVEWSVDPQNGGSITPAGYFQPSPSTEPRTVTIKATSLPDRSRTATAKVLTGAPWQTLDIGAVLVAGALQTGETLRVNGSGDVFGTADAFRFVFQALDGNGVITTRVETPATRDFTKAGLMIREALTPQSRHVFAGIISGKTSFMENRPQPGASTSVDFGPSTSPWLRLERKGDTFSAYTSADGDHWEPIGKPLNLRMAPRIFVGFAVSSGNHSSTTATFANIRLLPGTGAVAAMQ